MAQYTLTLNPSGYDTSNTSAGTISSISNAYTNSASTTYATVATPTSRNATSYISFTFDVSSIPSNATIDSVACYTKGAVNTGSTTRTSTFVAQLYNDTTAMGSSASIGVTTTATAANITSTGTWTRTTLDNLELRFTHTRGNSTGAVSMYLYGADLVITYTVLDTYNVTIASAGPGTTSPTGTQTVTEGDDLAISLQGDDATTTIAVTDNGTDVSSSIVYTTGTYIGTYTISNVTAAHTIAVTYAAAVTYTVTNTITNGVLISPTTESMTVTDGNSCTITFSGNTDLVLKSMTVAGSEVTPTWVESSSSYEYTIDSVTADTDVVITFGSAGPTLYVKGSSGWVKVTTIYRKTSDTTWEEVSTEEFNTSASSTTYKFIWKESEEATVVGTVTKGSNEISLDDSLPSDTYTLYYEDDDNTPLDNWNAIGTITK